MKKIGTVIYSMGVWNREVDKYVSLSNIYEGKSLVEILQEFIDVNIASYLNDVHKENVFAFDKCKVEVEYDEQGRNKYTILIGRVKSGDYGIESELFNIEDGTVYNRTANEADVIPFGFSIAVSAGEVTKGVLILQTLGNQGIKLSLQKRLDECIKLVDSRYDIMISEIVPKAYLKKFFDGGLLKKIRLIRYEIPHNEAERLGVNYGVKQTKEERIIHRPVGFFEHKHDLIREWMNGQKSYNQIIEIEGYDYDDLKLEFELGRTSKVISLRDTSGLRVSEDITEKVLIENGIPQFNSLSKVLRSMSEEYLEGMGLLVE